MGKCFRCGARCAVADGASADVARSRNAANVTRNGRVLGYVIEGRTRWSKEDTEKIVCVNCVRVLVEGEAAA